MTFYSNNNDKKPNPNYVPPSLTRISKEVKNINPERNFQIGDIVQHFKRETLTPTDDSNKYLYIIRGFANHTETGEMLVIYQGLYSPFDTYARPYNMFNSKVDKEKYPNIKQEYRFEIKV